MYLKGSKIHSSSSNNNHNNNYNQSEAQALKEIWDERDREIKRMDDLFQNLNKRIYGTQ